ncbi:hypothetical protein H0H92_012152 [Tricholoma furcatifolium]|nr:hypothetical protein H0H92_012152 [Tricholoma furcatifolium]
MEDEEGDPVSQFTRKHFKEAIAYPQSLTGKIVIGPRLLDFMPFNPIDKCTKITYLEESSRKLQHITLTILGGWIVLFGFGVDETQLYI